MVTTPGITRIDQRPGFTEEITDRLFECNIIDLIINKIEGKIELKGAPFSSWVLARLWSFTDGSIAMGLNVDEQGRGLQDGGWYTCKFKVIDEEQEVLAYLFLEGNSDYQQLYITSYQDYIDPEKMEQQLADILMQNFNEISPCNIIIFDPETRKHHQYGWDGEKFLGTCEIGY